MRYTREDKNRFATTFMEYAIMLGVITLALTTMNTYIKRGIQGRVKEMTDYFISPEQVVETDPTATTKSTSDTTSNITFNKEEYIGGATRLALLDTRRISASSEVVRAESHYSSSFIPAERANVGVPKRLDESNYISLNPGDSEINPNWEAERDIEALKREKERLLEEAKALEEQAQELETQVGNLINEYYNIDCPSSISPGHQRCTQAKRKMKTAIKKISAQAKELRNQALQSTEETEGVQQSIDALCQQCACCTN